METESFRTGTLRSGHPFPAILAGAAVIFLSLAPLACLADIYRWEDSTGTVHFTDDVTTIPPQYRKNSTMMIREAPSVGPPSQPPSSGSTRVEPPGEETVVVDVPPEEDDPFAEVEELKAKIAAKEQHIRAVDAKRSLATNPLRNRFVDQRDLDLYKKYKTELPRDRQHLRELEAGLESIR